MNEKEVREYIHKLRRFYTDALIYGVVNLILILIWALSGGGYFWPIFVIIGWGISLGIHAFTLDLIPQMNAMIPFMTAEWEDQEVRRLMEAGHKDKDTQEKKMAATKEEKSPFPKATKVTQKKVSLKKDDKA